MAQLSALDPPRIGAISADQAGKILAACPQLVITDAQAGSGAPAAQDTPRGSRGQFPSSRTPTDPTDLLLGAWDETRPDIRAAGHLFMSEGFRKNREELRRALDAGWRCPAASGAVAVMVPIDELRQWLQILVAHSRWASEHQHDYLAMTDDWLMAIKLAQQTCRSHLLMSRQWACSMESLTAKEMRLVAREGSAVVDALQLSKSANLAWGEPMTMEKSIEAERICMHAMLDDHFVREGGDWLDVSELVAGLLSSSSITGMGSASRLWNLTAPAFHDYGTACGRTDQYCAWLSRLIDMKSVAAAATASERGAVADIGRLDGINGSPLTWTLRVSRKCYVARTEMEASLAMLALSEYHRKNGHYPEMLGELVPDYLARLPIDYADRGVLRYRREKDDYVLYSAGADGVDEGGRRSADDGSGRRDPDMVLSDVKRDPEAK